MLVFLPGVGEIRQVGRELSPIAERAGIQICELYGDMPLARQQEVLQPGGGRKVILATNVAETSLTIDGVTVVVDSGLARVAHVDTTTGINRLEIERISRASADQRAGRAGRTAPGVCYRLWTEREQQALAEFDQPEVARVDVSGAVLELLSWGETDVATFPWFEPPSPASIEQALRSCSDWGRSTPEVSQQSVMRWRGSRCTRGSQSCSSKGSEWVWPSAWRGWPQCFPSAIASSGRIRAHREK